MVTHARPLVSALEDRDPDVQVLELAKDFGETYVVDQQPLERPPWQWPKR